LPSDRVLGSDSLSAKLSRSGKSNYRTRPLASLGQVLDLAKEGYADSTKLQSILPFLHTDLAASAALFGDALGTLDLDGLYFDTVMSLASESGNSALARGYVMILVARQSRKALVLNHWLDLLEQQNPHVAFGIALAADEISHPIERMLQMIRSQQLPAHALRSLQVGPLIDRTTDNTSPLWRSYRKRVKVCASRRTKWLVTSSKCSFWT